MQKSIVFLYVDNGHGETTIFNIYIIYYNSKQNEMFQFTFIKTCTGSVCWSLENANERNKTYINGEAYCVHELEEST